MARLKAAVLREYEDSEAISLEVYMPRNTQAVELYFRGEKMAKVMGSLATNEAVEDLRLSGVLVKRGFNYHLIHPSDLSSMSSSGYIISSKYMCTRHLFSDYTELTTNSLCQVGRGNTQHLY